MPVFNFMSIHFHTATASNNSNQQYSGLCFNKMFFIFYGVGSANIVYIYILSIGEEF